MNTSESFCISYTLTLEEAQSALYGSGRLKPYKKRSIFQTVVAVVAIAFFVMDVFRNPKDIFAFVMIFLGAMLIVSCNVVPRRIEREYMQDCALLTERTLTVNPRVITLERSNGELKILPQDIAQSNVAGDILFITSNDGIWIELPLRAIDEGQLKTLDAIIHSSLS